MYNHSKRGNSPLNRSRVSIALLLLMAIVLPSAGCRNTGELPETSALQSVVDQDKVNLAQMQSTIDGLRTKVSEQQNTIEDLSKSPLRAPWYERFLNWLVQTFGQWIADNVVEWLHEFLSAFGM